MKLYEDYLLLRSHFESFDENEEIEVTMEEIAKLLFCSTRNAKLILIKFMNQNWVTYTPGIGRGNISKLSFYVSSHDILNEAAEQMALNGNLEGALLLIKAYGNDHTIKEYFQKFLSKYFGFSLKKNENELSDTLRFPIFRPINTLEPAESYFAFDTHMVKQIFNTLVEFDHINTIVKPSISHYWESFNEATEWVFYIRKKIFFHNGKELTADDVVYSLKRMNSSSSKWLIHNIHSIRIINKYCIKVILCKPNKIFDVFFSYPQASIVPKGFYEGGDKIPIGTGPYKVTKFTTEICLLESFDYYFEHNALIDKIEIYNLSLLNKDRFEDEYGSNLLFVETGEFKVKNERSWEKKEEISGTTLLTLNQHKKSPLMNQCFRRALHHLINRERMIQDLGKLRAFPSNGFLLFHENFNESDQEFNPDFGLELLNLSNYNGENIKLFTYFRHSDDAFWIKEYLQSYGINIDVRILDWADMLDLNMMKEADMILFEAVLSRGVVQLIEYYQSDNSFIKQHLDSEKIEQLTSILQDTMSDDLSPKEILEKCQKILIEDQSIIFLNYMMFRTHIHPSLNALSSNFNGWIDFKNIWIKTDQNPGNTLE